MRVTELFVASPLRVGPSGNRLLTHIKEGEQEVPDPATLRKQLAPITMEAHAFGVVVSVGVERYLAPWGSVSSARLVDGAAPGEVGGGPLVLPPLSAAGREELAAMAARAEGRVERDASAAWLPDMSGQPFGDVAAQRQVEPPKPTNAPKGGRKSR